MTITIKFAVLRGGGIGGREENHPKRCFLARATPRQYTNFEAANVIVDQFCTVIAQALSQKSDLKKARKRRSGNVSGIEFLLASQRAQNRETPRIASENALGVLPEIGVLPGVLPRIRCCFAPPSGRNLQDYL